MPERKKIVILGATGSIGTQTLDICAQHPDRLEVVGLVANQSADHLKQLAAQYSVPDLALMDERAASEHGLPGGMDAIVQLVTRPDVRCVVVAVAGVIGLAPTLAAIHAGKDIALASKEVLVAAGEVVMPLVQEMGISFTPIDSEHSAIFQCLQGTTPDQVEGIILTASGGPFRGKKREELAHITVDQALNHPTWNMGGKITIDSATLMNKALETIEAMWLFGLTMDQVSVVVHPQSIIHSMVTLKDTSVLGQFGWPDMRIPIQYSLLYPERKANQLRKWSPVETPNLTFEAVDQETFPALGLAKLAVERGGTTCCAFNAANEAAVAHFLAGRTGFLQISELVASTIEEHVPVEPTLENLLQVDAWARTHIEHQLIHGKP